MNRDSLIERLKHDLSTGRVVTITGTGVSTAACGGQEVEGCKVGTWSGLLRHGVNHCKYIGAVDDVDVELLTMQIESGRTDYLIHAAETISGRMKARSEGIFRGWLKETVGALKVKDRSVLEAVSSLPGILATLNYDSLLEIGTGRRPVTWMDADKTQDILRSASTEAVLHLHGWWEAPQSVIFGLSSYLNVKSHQHAVGVLNSMLVGNVLLFVGCGDTVLDPNFAQLVEWGTEALKDVSPRHYLLCRTAEVSSFQQKLANAPWLQPLDYGLDYTDLVPFLCSLVGSPVRPENSFSSKKAWMKSDSKTAVDPIHVRIRNARLDLHLRQNQIAEMVGCTASAISRFERGDRQVLSNEWIENICKHLGLSIEPLTADEELQNDQEQVAFCGNYDCPSGIRQIIRGRLFVQPTAFLVFQQSQPVHCPDCGEPLSFGCTGAMDTCLTQVTAGATFCVGCGEPLVKVPRHLHDMELDDVADRLNENRDRNLQGKKPVVLPVPHFRNRREPR